MASSTIVRPFADTNIIVYTESDDEEKPHAPSPSWKPAPISMQVINETVAVLTRKHAFALEEAHHIASSLIDSCEVVPVNTSTSRKRSAGPAQYQLSHWDSLIVGAALLAECDTLYSEDMQHGQVFDSRLTIVNPFRAE